MAGMHRSTGAVITGDEEVFQQIREVLSTRMGTRVFRRRFGSRVPDLVGRPMNPTVQAALQAETMESISRWVPSVSVEKVRVLTGEEEVFSVNPEVRIGVDRQGRVRLELTLSVNGQAPVVMAVDA